MSSFLVRCPPLSRLACILVLWGSLFTVTPGVGLNSKNHMFVLPVFPRHQFMLLYAVVRGVCSEMMLLGFWEISNKLIGFQHVTTTVMLWKIFPFTSLSNTSHHNAYQNIIHHTSKNWTMKSNQQTSFKFAKKNCSIRLWRWKIWFCNENWTLSLNAIRSYQNSHELRTFWEFKWINEDFSWCQ